MPQSLARIWLHITFSTAGRRAYLQNERQAEHHRTMSFQEESRLICQKHEIDERYVWD